MSRHRPTVSVVMACHDRRARTLLCLDSLRRQTADAAWRLVVFDDGSTDGTAEAVREFWPDAVLLRGDGQSYWAGGMRAALDRSVAMGADYHLWLNDDVVLRPDAVAHLLSTHAAVAPQGSGLALVGGAVSGTAEATYGGVRRRSRWQPLRFVFCGPDPIGPVPCDALNGNVVLMSDETARRVGPIGPAFRQTLADLDYGLRVGRAGGWVGLAPGLVGTCAANDLRKRWFNPDLPLHERWRVVRHPLGFPLRPWLSFARSHGGPFWPLLAAAAYWPLFVPTGLAIRLRRRAARRTDQREMAHGT